MSKVISERDYVPFDTFRQMGFSTKQINDCLTALKPSISKVENYVRMNKFKYKKGKHEVEFPIMKRKTQTKTTVTFFSEASLPYMLVLFGTIKDNHVAFETLQYEKNYTGERVAYEQRQLYATSTENYTEETIDDLIDVLIEKEENRDFVAVNAIYHALKEKDVAEDLWLESLSYGLWIPQIVISIVDPTIAHVSVIENVDLFQMVVNYMNIDYTNADAVSEELGDYGKIQFLKDRVPASKIKRWKAEKIY